MKVNDFPGNFGDVINPHFTSNVVYYKVGKLQCVGHRMDSSTFVLTRVSLYNIYTSHF